jgi:hypothetical protein
LWKQTGHPVFELGCFSFGLGEFCVEGQQEQDGSTEQCKLQHAFDAEMMFDCNYGLVDTTSTGGKWLAFICGKVVIILGSNEFLSRRFMWQN